MTEEASRTPEDPNGTGVNSGVVGSQPNTPESTVSQEDFNAWKSKMDQQVAAMQAQYERQVAENEMLRNQSFESKLEDLPEAERYKLMYEQEQQRRAEAEQATKEHQAKQQYATELSSEFGIPAGQLMAYSTAPEMRKAAKDYYTQQIIQQYQTADAPPSPTSTPAPGGATLQQRQPEKSPDEVRQDALNSGDALAFIASFTQE